MIIECVRSAAGGHLLDVIQMLRPARTARLAPPANIHYQAVHALDAVAAARPAPAPARSSHGRGALGGELVDVYKVQRTRPGRRRRRWTSPGSACGRCRGGRQAGAGAIATWAHSAPGGQLRDLGQLQRSARTARSASSAKIHYHGVHAFDAVAAARPAPA